MTRLLCCLFLLFAVGCWQDQGQADPIPDHQTFEIESVAVGETRVICVWLPPGYSETGERYPVLYMPDGGVKEDFPHIANSIAELIAADQIPPTIVVGIENTERRRDLTGPSNVASDAEIAPITDGSSRFREFIAAELFPEIENRYRTSDKRAIVGESAAGLFVVETMMVKPGMFDTYIAMDPAIYWNDSFLVKQAETLLSGTGQRSTRLWFATSGEPDIAPDVLALNEKLLNLQPDWLTWEFQNEPQEQHNTIFRATKADAFRWALSNDQPDNE